MDIDLQVLIPIILAVLYLIFGGARRRKSAQQTPPTDTNTEVNIPPDSDVVLPPFMQNFEGIDPHADELQETVASEVEELPMETEQTETEPVQEPEPEKKPIEPPPVPVDSRSKVPLKPLPGTALLDISPSTFRQGIILSEILKKPKGLRNQ